MCDEALRNSLDIVLLAFDSHKMMQNLLWEDIKNLLNVFLY